ncbi:CaiB/BaiF CoA transferase family protein [Bermanella sp. WJH001]|uniref:CaiB/BaiF CoA transferase family protein n=1 Tax=Bermanella sp. WJH001 TaxID=3048005 RepID=UPI0024BDBFD5|nr:CaiB/BaiF CoA-transferase family protein [Bermanella sp. WJH001]MDJ1538233.1 CaiB/BaiF CoA-transferase family protein [Bermanella sp. WJH001]
MSSQALSQLNILDFSTLLPGPYASLMLADMGANVLRIESPTRPDLVRALPPLDASGQSAAHSYLNRNKQAIALDLKQPAALDIVKKLLDKYDIVLEQFRPGVMQRLGLGFEQLREINPRVIYCSITGYGQTGPLKDRAGHDINYLALSGVADYSRRQGEKPVPQGVQIADIAGGSHHAVMGILAAVIEREHTGLGQHVDISMTDCAFSLNAMFASGYLGGQIEPQAESTMLNGGSFYDYYETSDGRYMSVGSLEPPFLMQLCQTLNIQQHIGKAGSQKSDEVAEFKDVMRDAFLQHDFKHWCQVFETLDCCVEPVLSFAEAACSAQAQERQWVKAAHVNEKEIKQLTNPIMKDHGIQNTGGKIGAHTQNILKDLGFSPLEIEQLKQHKVIA